MRASMMFAVLLAFAAPAFAQQQLTVRQVLDGGTAAITRIVADKDALIARDQDEIAQMRKANAALTKQVADLTKERDSLKAKTPDAAPEAVKP
jgi:hypothetical protein